MSYTRLKQVLKEARRRDVRTELDQYLWSKEPFTGQPTGLVGKLFIPASDLMERFRQEAAKAATREKIWHLERDLPRAGFEAWFLDWTAPKRHRVERRGVALVLPVATTTSTSHMVGTGAPPQESRAGAGTTRNGTAPPPKRGRGRPKGALDFGRIERDEKMKEAWKQGVTAPVLAERVQG
jgi:hypothetical protein